MTSSAGQTAGAESQEGELSRPARYMILAVALLHLVLAWLGRNAGIGWGEDDAQYFNLARDLTHFSYHERWDIAAPFHARYPPLFPLLLAVVGVPSGWNIDVMLFFVALMSAATIVILADAVRRRFGTEVALVVALLLTVNPMWLQDAGVLMSEALFKFFLAIALWGIAREDEGWRYAMLAGAAVIAAALTRTAGISLIVGIVAYWLWRRRFRWVATFVVAAALTVGAWTAMAVFAPDAQNHRLYVSDMTQLGSEPAKERSPLALPLQLLRRVPSRMKTLGTVMIPFVLAFRTVAGTIIDNVAWLALLSVTGVIGFFVLCKRWLGSAAILASYLALVVLWTWAVERFLTPVAPLLYLTMLMGAVGIAERFAPRWRRATLLGTGALLVLGPLFESSALIGARVSCDRQHPDVSPGCYTEDERIFLQIAEWVRDSTPPNAVVMTNKDAAFFTHSDRLVINQFRALEEDSASIIPYLRKRGVSYVVVGPIGVRIINHGHLLAKACRDLVVVREFPKASSVLRVRGADEEYDSRNACQALEPWTRLKLPNRQ